MSDDIGDSMLSSQDVRLWALVQHVLLTWGTLVPVQIRHYDVPRQRAGSVRFFVPRDATFRDEIVAYLEKEGRQFASPEYPAQPDKGFPRVPPTHLHVDVVTFSGLLPYIDEEASKASAREWAKVAMQRLKGELARTRKEDLAKAGPDPWWAVFPIDGPDPIASFASEETARHWAESRNGKFFVRPVPNPVIGAGR